jgi:hypothetical protein
MPASAGILVFDELKNYGVVRQRVETAQWQDAILLKLERKNL